MLSLLTQLSLPFMFFHVKNMVKTVKLGQDSTFHNKDGGFFIYPPSPFLKDGVLYYSYSPTLSEAETTEKDSNIPAPFY